MEKQTTDSKVLSEYAKLHEGGEGYEVIFDLYLDEHEIFVIATNPDAHDAGFCDFVVLWGDEKRVAYEKFTELSEATRRLADLVLLDENDELDDELDEKAASAH